MLPAGTAATAVTAHNQRSSVICPVPQICKQHGPPELPHILKSLAAVSPSMSAFCSSDRYSGWLMKATWS